MHFPFTTVSIASSHIETHASSIGQAGAGNWPPE